MKFSKTRGAFAVMGIAAVAILGVAGTANAANIPGSDPAVVTTLAPGAQGTVLWNYTGTQAATIDLSAGAAVNSTFGNVVFTAPPHTTFPTQGIAGVDGTGYLLSDGTKFGAGSNYATTTCALSNGNKTLTCTLAKGTNGMIIDAGVGVYFNIPVKVDADAPADTALVGSATINGTNGQTVTSSLNVHTPAEVPTPLVDPAIAGGAAVVALGAAAVVARRKGLLGAR